MQKQRIGLNTKVKYKKDDLLAEHFCPTAKYHASTRNSCSWLSQLLEIVFLTS